MRSVLSKVKIKYVKTSVPPPAVRRWPKSKLLKVLKSTLNLFRSRIKW